MRSTASCSFKQSTWPLKIDVKEIIFQRMISEGRRAFNLQGRWQGNDVLLRVFKSAKCAEINRVRSYQSILVPGAPSLFASTVVPTDMISKFLPPNHLLPPVTDGLLFSFISGRTLEHLKGKGWFFKIEVLYRLASIFAVLHAEGVTHAHLALRNIIVSTYGHPYLLDFAMPELHTQQGITRTMPPSEQASPPEAPVGSTVTMCIDSWCAVDIYQLGALIRTLLLEGDVPPAADGLREFVARCTSFTPEERPDISAVIHQLSTRVPLWHLLPAPPSSLRLIEAPEDVRRTVLDMWGLEKTGRRVQHIHLISNPDLTLAFLRRASSMRPRRPDPRKGFPEWLRAARGCGSEREADIEAYLAQDAQQAMLHRFQHRCEALRRLRGRLKSRLIPQCMGFPWIVPAWHGSDRSVLDWLPESGFASFSLLDAGIYGAGIYNALEQEYAAIYSEHDYRPSSSGSCFVVLSFVAVGDFLPVVESPTAPDSYAGRGVTSGYTSHLVDVRKGGDEKQSDYVPAGFGDVGVFTEIVLSQENQILPFAVIEYTV